MFVVYLHSVAKIILTLFHSVRGSAGIEVNVKKAYDCSERFLILCHGPRDGQRDAGVLDIDE